MCTRINYLATLNFLSSLLLYIKRRLNFLNAKRKFAGTASQYLSGTKCVDYERNISKELAAEHKNVLLSCPEQMVKM